MSLEQPVLREPTLTKWWGTAGAPSIPRSVDSRPPHRSSSPGYLDTYSRGSEQRVHTQGDGRGEGDARRRGLARRRARRRRAQTSYRSGCPIALPCPETQPIVLSTKIVVRGAPQAHEAASRARRSK